MTEPMTPQEVKVVFGPYEEHGEPERRLVPVWDDLTGALLYYREVVVPQYARKRVETWSEPERIEPVFGADGNVTARRIPRRTFGRWEWDR
jgi:hypothetical protein